MTKPLRLLFAFLSSLILASTLCSIAQAVDMADAPQKKISADNFMTSLKFQSGQIKLPNGVATLNLPTTFRYLAPAEAERVLVDGWGNPPGAQTLGMILPANVNPLSAEAWGVIVTYNEDGHVKDDDADAINYDDLLKDMKEATLAGNEERQKQGYPAMTLVGWAEKPSYDKSTHKFYWAKELGMADSKESSLNYNIRVLGRKGVLVLNAIAGMNQIAEIKSEMKNVVAFTEFTPENRYADFNSSTDKVAEYGLAALVAGGVAAKLGFFGKIFALLLAFKKILLVGLIATGGAISKFFGRKKQD